MTSCLRDRMWRRRGSTPQWLRSTEMHHSISELVPTCSVCGIDYQPPTVGPYCLCRSIVFTMVRGLLLVVGFASPHVSFAVAQLC